MDGRLFIITGDDNGNFGRHGKDYTVRITSVLCNTN
jgi:hypothetical protein